MHNLPHEDLKGLSKEELLEPFASDIGGGDAYDATAFGNESQWTDVQTVDPEEADFEVSTKTGLLSAVGKLNKTEDGGIIHLNCEVLDLGGQSDVTVDAPITFVSGRGREDYPTTTLKLAKPQPLFQVWSGGVRFTGIEICADEPERFDPKDRYPNVPPGDAVYKVGASGGIYVQDAGEDGVEIDNCLFSGFTYAGVAIRRDKAKDDTVEMKTHIHHCSFENNPCDDLGYGIAVRQGSPLVEYCYFDNNRHDITASGWSNSHYVFRYNVIGPVSWSHSIDIHGEDQDSDVGRDLTKIDRFEGEDIEGYKSAGGRFSIHHNILMIKEHTGIKFRGVPAKGMQLHGNIHYFLDDAEGFGEEGKGYFVAANLSDVSPGQCKFSRKNPYHGNQDFAKSIGPPGMPSVTDLQGDLDNAKKEIETLEPKADQRDKIKETFDIMLGEDDSPADIPGTGTGTGDSSGNTESTSD